MPSQTLDLIVRLDDQATAKLSSLGGAITGVGQKLTTGLTLPLAGVAVGVTAMANDFNAGMANVASLIPGNTERVEELKSSVQALAIETGTGTGIMAEGLYTVISAFGDTADTVAILDTNARAATAGVATTGEAIALTSAVTKGYGDITAEAVEKAADLATTTVRLGQTTFPELASSIGAVTPLAAALGVTQEELFGVMATGAGVTGSAGEVATQFRGILQSLMAPTASMTTLISDMGFASGEAMLAELGLQGSIEAITGAAETSGEPLQAYIGSIEGQTLAMALAGPQAATLTSNITAMQGAAGATAQAFMDQTQGVNASGFAMEQAKVQAIVLAQNMGDALAPAIMLVVGFVQSLIPYIEQAVTWFTNLDPSLQLIIVGMAGLAAAIGPVLMVVGTLVSTWGTLSAAFSAAVPIITSIGALLTGPLVVAIAAVVAAVALLYTAWVNDWGGIQGKTQEALAAIQNIIQTVMAAVQAFITSALAEIQAFWTAHGAQVMALVQAFMAAVEAVFVAILNAVSALITNTLATIAQFWQAHGASIMTIVTAFMNTVQTVITTALSLIQSLITTVLSAVQSLWTNHGTTITNIARTTWETIKTIINGVLVIIGAIIDAFAAAVTGDWTAFGEQLRVIWDTAWATIKTVLQNAVGILLGVVQNLISAIIGAFTSTDWGSVGSSIISGIAGAISGGAGAIADAARGVAGAALQAAKAALGIGSPSKVFAQAVGLPIVQGLAEGISDNMGLAEKAVVQGMTSLAGVNTPTLAPAFARSGTTRGGPVAGFGAITINIDARGAAPGAATDIARQTEKAVDLAMRKAGIGAASRIRTRTGGHLI